MQALAAPDRRAGTRQISGRRRKADRRIGEYVAETVAWVVRAIPSEQRAESDAELANCRHAEDEGRASGSHGSGPGNRSCGLERAAVVGDYGGWWGQIKRGSNRSEEDRGLV